MKKLLITKLKTTNIGNQALSDEIIKLYENDKSTLHVAGRPEGLFGYSIEKLVKTRDPLRTFQRWGDELLKYLQVQESDTTFRSHTERVNLLSASEFKVKNDAFFQFVKSFFRKYIHSDSIYARAYAKRFRKVLAADALIYNGAGEVRDNNIFLRQLLELYVAQQMGKRTFAINQSVEVFNNPVKDICALVYGKMDGIVVRGDASRSNLISIGVPAEKVSCFPDSAFLNDTPGENLVTAMKKKYGVKLPAVAINATSVLDDMSGWKQVVDALRLRGFHLYFISNDPFGDEKIGKRFQNEFGVIPILDSLDYHSYSALLANFKFVISCRLHTNELALTAGRPIIAIEGSHFKTHEVFSLVEYPVPVVNPGNKEWHTEIKNHIGTILSDSPEIDKFISNLNAIRKLSLNNRLVTETEIFAK